MSHMRRDDVDRFFEHNVHLPTRTIFVGGPEVDEEMSEYFLKAMHLLSGSSSERITIVANNPGGDEYHGLAMYDVIASSHCPITYKMYGYAMSMGSWIPQAADDRAMSANCAMMLHYGSWGGYEMDGAHVASNAAEAARLTKLMEETYLRRIREVHPKFTIAKLRAMIGPELYLTAKDALQLGLIDRIIEEW